MQQFLIKSYPPRKNFLEQQSQEEKNAIKAHFEYLKGLMEKGTLAFAGRCEDATFGLALLKCESLEAAKELICNDPAVKAKVFSTECFSFSTALADLNNL